jgi:hypothetical protein
MLKVVPLNGALFCGEEKEKENLITNNTKINKNHTYSEAFSIFMQSTFNCREY